MKKQQEQGLHVRRNIRSSISSPGKPSMSAAGARKLFVALIISAVRSAHTSCVWIAVRRGRLFNDLV